MSVIDRYRAQVSGPLLDRIDALIEVPPLTITALDDRSGLEPSSVVRARVAAARRFRAEHQGAAVPGRAGLTVPAPGAGSGVRGNGLSRDAQSLLREALVRDGLSGRGYVRVMALARTIADLDLVERVSSEHVAEALALRLDLRRLVFV